MSENFETNSKSLLSISNLWCFNLMLPICIIHVVLDFKMDANFWENDGR
jgi:hypothetical protein